MIKHPSESFIKFLMTSMSTNATKSDNDWVQNMVVSLGYPAPDSDYLIKVRGDLSLKIPANFQPTNRYHQQSRKFLQSEGIWGLHNPDKATREANLVVTNLRARPIIESLLLGRIEPKEIAKKVNARLGEFFTTEGIDAYKHYYWNVGLLTVEDWDKLLKDYDLQRQNTMAIIQAGPAMALHKTGFQQQIDSKSMLRNMQETLYFDFMEWRSKPHGSERTKSMAALARTSVLVDIQMSQADSALKDSLKAFEQFRMKHAEAGVPDMKQVAPGGNYTGSGAKLLDAGPIIDKEETS
jgi:hypothetical protein